MRRAARIDANHNKIVALLRKCGASVQSLAGIGSGCPDLLIGWQGKNILAEVKDGSKCPSAQKLTPHENEWHLKWGGQVVVINSEHDALRIIGVEI